MPQAYQTRSNYAVNQVARPASAAGKRGGRRPKEYEEYDHVAMSEEERDKRDKRRLRNKEAAARCRQRRLDLMETLQKQVNQLQAENRIKDAKIEELQRMKSNLMDVIRVHHCVIPDSLRHRLDVDMSSIQQYMPRDAAVTSSVSNAEIGQYPSAPQSPPSLLNRKRPASEMISDLRLHQQNQSSILMHGSASTMPMSSGNQSDILSKVKQESPFKGEPTLYDVNGRDLADEEMKRPTSLSFSDSVTTTYSTLSSSGVPITTPSNLMNGASNDFGCGNLLDGPTGLTPCHPPQATAFPISSNNTPLGDGRSFETL